MEPKEEKKESHYKPPHVPSFVPRRDYGDDYSDVERKQMAAWNAEHLNQMYNPNRK